MAGVVNVLVCNHVELMALALLSGVLIGCRHHGLLAGDRIGVPFVSLLFEGLVSVVISVFIGISLLIPLRVLLWRRLQLLIRLVRLAAEALLYDGQGVRHSLLVHLLDIPRGLLRLSAVYGVQTLPVVVTRNSRLRFVVTFSSISGLVFRVVSHRALISLSLHLLASEVVVPTLSVRVIRGGVSGKFRLRIVRLVRKFFI